MGKRPIDAARQVLSKYDITSPPATLLTHIADSESIFYEFTNLPSEPDLSGELILENGVAGILVNTHIKSKGRHNFTFAHELGHYFLKHEPSYTQDGNGFWCTVKDIGDTPHPKEAEANRFAVELLMPEEQFRPLMIGSPIDFALINNLSREFEVSKHACSFRLLDFLREPYVVIITKGHEITGRKQSRAAKGHPFVFDAIPVDTVAHQVIENKLFQENFAECDPVKWFGSRAKDLWIYSCTRCHESGVGMTILRW